MPESSKSDSRVSGHLFVCQETIDTPALRGAPSTYYTMTPSMPDLDNSQNFYARLYEAFSARDNDQYSADEARIPQKYQTVRQELALPLADISLTTANMDMKLILLDRGTCGLSDDSTIARFR